MKRHIYALLALIGFSIPAQADSLFGEFKRLPDEIERGFYIGADLGFSFLRGDVNGNLAGTTAKNPGYHLAFTLGYDLMKNVSIETVSTMLIHEADPNDPLLTGGVNLFLFDLGAKLQLPYKRWNPFVFIGGGVGITRPDFVADENNKLSVLVAGGIEYYTLLRHYSLYAKVSYHYIDLPVDDISVSAGLKYTF